jgi:hypothetical protein
MHKRLASCLLLYILFYLIFYLLFYFLLYLIFCFLFCFLFYLLSTRYFTERVHPHDGYSMYGWEEKISACFGCFNLRRPSLTRVFNA